MYGMMNDQAVNRRLIRARGCLCPTRTSIYLIQRIESDRIARQIKLVQHVCRHTRAYVIDTVPIMYG